MDKKEIFIGVDVSKLTVDFTVLCEGSSQHKVVKNTVGSIRSYFKGLQKSLGFEPDHVYVGVENTGRYGWPCLEFFSSIGVELYLLSALHLHRSMGLVRGKTDAVDSARIAQFMRKNHSELLRYCPPRKELEALGLLLSRRNKVLKIIKQLRATGEEMSCVSASKTKAFILKEGCRDTAYFTKKQKRVEQEIEQLIKQDEQLNHQRKLITSVPGAGRVLCWYLLVKTNEFKNFNDPRKLACYAGVAPFPYSSGTSVKGKTRVSSFADKMLKKTLHMGALRASTLDGELGQFYQRKVAEGKNKMAVLNALRNKIIHRVMAAIRNDRPYIKNYNRELLLS